MKLEAAIILSAHAKDTPIDGTQTEMHGLPITIEHKAGTKRKLFNDAGKAVYSVHMHHDYGFLNDTKGRDGDEVDCFLGPMKGAKEVYVVHMKDLGPDVKEREDEDKCFLGFPSADAAKQSFLAHYPENFYGGMTCLPVLEFKKKLAGRKVKITAGGPGSGRHAEYGQMHEAFTKAGFKKHDAKTETAHYFHPEGGQYITLKDSGAWHRKDSPDNERGTGVKSLQQHLRGED